MHCYFRVVCVALVLPAFSQYVCMYVSLSINICVHIHVSICTCIHTCICTHVLGQKRLVAARAKAHEGALALARCREHDLPVGPELLDAGK